MPKIFYGWIIIAAMGVMNFAIQGAGLFNMGLFIIPMCRDIGISRSMFGWLVTSRSLAGGLSTFLLGYLVDRFGSRCLLPLSALITGLCMIGFGLSDQVKYLFPLFILIGLAGLAAGGGGVLTAVPVAKWFVRKRGLAIGIATLGTGLGAVFFIPFTQFFIEHFGWRKAWFVLAVLLMSLIVPIASLVVRRQPEDLGLLPDGDTEKDRLSQDPSVITEEAVWTVRDAMGTRSFWLLNSAMLLWGMANGAAVHRIAFWIQQGFDAQLVSFVFTIDAVGFSVVVVFDELNKEDLVEILKNPNNPIIVSKRQDFMSYGIDIKFEDEALAKIAEMAASEKTGARGLVSAVEKVLIPFEKNLPSTDIRRVLVTPGLVDDPEKELLSLKKNPDDPDRIKRFEKMAEKELEDIMEFIASREGDFHQLSGFDLYKERRALIAKTYLKNTSDINTAVEDFVRMYKEVRQEEILLSEKLDIHISFDDSAVDEIIRQAIEMAREPGPLAFYTAKKLEYGLKLIKDRSGMEEFVINGEAITDMENFVNNLIKKSYQEECDRPQDMDRIGEPVAEEKRTKRTP